MYFNTPKFCGHSALQTTDRYIFKGRWPKKEDDFFP